MMTNHIPFVVAKNLPYGPYQKYQQRFYSKMHLHHLVRTLGEGITTMVNLLCRTNLHKINFTGGIGSKSRGE